MKRKRMLRTIVIILLGLLGIWLILEIGMRLYVAGPLETDFYSSLPRELVPDRQSKYGVQVSRGSGWIHLGWIADPENETYRIDRFNEDAWVEMGEAQYGSFLIQDASSGTFRVVAYPKDGSQSRVIGEISTSVTESSSLVLVPTIAGDWQPIFKPAIHGYYINDHTIFQDSKGDWRLMGITDKSDGNFDNEVYFASGVSADFPPVNGMKEEDPVADFGELAWAPHVIHDGERYHMFWSPHKLHQMDSEDGISWENHQVTMPAPYHKFFRDPMVLNVAKNQWLLYTTAREGYYSRVDVYQSFNLNEWQYIRPALQSGWGSERNSPFSSMESPFVVDYQGHYYLLLTYNNDSFFWPGILMLFHIWLNPESYNDTLVFHESNPYDFGVYKGVDRSPTLLTRLITHAPEVIYNPDSGRWYITTAGWPWVASLTSGEVAAAPLEWQPLPGE